MQHGTPPRWFCRSLNGLGVRVVWSYWLLLRHWGGGLADIDPPADFHAEPAVIRPSCRHGHRLAVPFV